MREICTQDESFRKLIPAQTTRSDALYVPSRYTLPFDYNGRRYLYNTMTRQCLETPYPLSVYADEKNETLIRGRFLVPSGTDECSFYLSVLNLLRTYQRKTLLPAYTILPTLGCNARCVYCFQKGMEQTGMTDETAAASLRFILGGCSGKHTVLNWFGGEPLLRTDVIDRICGGMRGAGVEYHSLMVSNGSLITPEIVEKMTGLWQLERIQISMDGAEEDYISRKRYPEYRGYYHAVIDAVNLMAEAGISVAVRCNADGENLGRIPQFISDLAAGAANKENVSVYLTPLYQVTRGNHALEIWPELLEMRDVILSAGFEVTHERVTAGLPTSRCMADAGGIVIAPDGKLYCCENLPENALIGNVREGVTRPDVRRDFSAMDRVREKCMDCAFLPDCTPFASCPIFETHCREARLLFTLDALKRVLRKKDEEPGGGDPRLPGRAA